MKIHIIKSSENGQYHWHVKSRNGQIVAVTGETYLKVSQCQKMIQKLFGDRFPVVMPERGRS